MPLEELIVKFATVLAITALFSFIGWILALILGMFWSVWFILIIFVFTYRIFAKVNK